MRRGGGNSLIAWPRIGFERRLAICPLKPKQGLHGPPSGVRSELVRARAEVLSGVRTGLHEANRRTAGPEAAAYGFPRSYTTGPSRRAGSAKVCRMTARSSALFTGF